MDASQLSKYIDHTNVKPDATEQDIIKLCSEAVTYDFASACVSSCWATLAHKKLDGSGVLTCCVVGFPFGAQAPGVKAFEAREAVDNGAEEIDAVINIGFLRSGFVDRVEQEMREVVKASGSAPVKFIIETCYLTDEQKVVAAGLARDAGASYVKTSTGYGPSGARLEDVELIKLRVPGIKIKASGGIRSLDEAKMFIEAGASRIGTSAGPKIMDGIR